MFDKLEKIIARYDELTSLLADPDVINHQDRYRELSKEHSELTPIVASYKLFKKAKGDVDNLFHLIESSDAEMRELAQAELSDSEAKLLHKETMCRI